MTSSLAASTSSVDDDVAAQLDDVGGGLVDVDDDIDDDVDDDDAASEAEAFEELDGIVRHMFFTPVGYEPWSARLEP